MKFFGPVEEAAGTRHALLEIPDGATVRDAVAAVRGAIPGLKELGEGARVRYAVNAEYADETRRLKAGDVVALIPPVGGG
ncbi:MAG TPA: MoaD/ThiS family protein [Planctomycetota bacterium]|nr:MoaD/ThiS family protein [Planctomycetota bacterium]